MLFEVVVMVVVVVVVVVVMGVVVEVEVAMGGRGGGRKRENNKVNCRKIPMKIVCSHKIRRSTTSDIPALFRGN